ncbi:MAG: pirin family protein [Bacteroidetes bacterium]|nr:MAG: pirin family protein [Bacteroidota bacterium]
MNRTIYNILPAQKVNMGGIILDQPLPLGSIQQIDPFLLLHHWESGIDGGQLQRDLGVGPHPHRGFSPVTFIFKGGVHHRDSMGNNEVIYAGGTQWMNSGKGVIHSERPDKELAQNGGDFELIQLWINTPAEFKLLPAEYHSLTGEDTPQVTSPDGKVSVGVVSGIFKGVKGPIPAYSQLTALRIDLRKGGKMNFPFPSEFNTFIYQLDGSLTINEATETKARDLIWFNNEEGNIKVEAKADTRAILLAGKPIDEALSTYGPFVMNSQREIMNAIKDYQQGKMGELVEEF